MSDATDAAERITDTVEVALNEGAHGGSHTRVYGNTLPADAPSGLMVSVDELTKLYEVDAMNRAGCEVTP